MGDTKFETEGLDEMIRGFKEASIPNKRTAGIGKLNERFDLAAEAVDHRVHVETGRLRLSGRADKHHMFDAWVGEIKYRRYPGIFELARGDKPTRNHPEGRHFFFNAVDPFIPVMDKIVNDMIYDYFGKV